MFCLRLLGAIEPGLRARLRILLRYVSRLLVLWPSRFRVVGTVSPAVAPGLRERLAWFLGSRPDIRLAVHTHEGWRWWRTGKDQVADDGPATAFGAWVAGALGKLLVLDYDERWKSWDTRLHYKVFIINWTRDYRVSSWRLAASRPNRPFGSLSRNISRPDHRPRTDACVVLGTGPSAHRVLEPEYAGLDLIICNTAIKSDALMSRRVVAVCFIDATFFIGPSDYTRAFYTRLNEVAASRDFSLYIDFEHEEFVRSRLPNVAPDRFHPVFLNSTVGLKPNFKSGRFQRTSHSVFTSVMLPLAATYYRRIHLIGFDGKNPQLTNYFWKHSDEFQFNELLPTVRASDPGFFSGRDYQSFAKENDRQVDEFVTAVEASGCDVRMEHPSFIEPLQRRFLANPTALAVPRAN